MARRAAITPWPALAAPSSSISTAPCSAAGPRQVLNAALVDEGGCPGRSLPGDRLLYTVYDRFGENLLAMGLARAAALVAKGWSQEPVRRPAGGPCPR